MPWISQNQRWKALAMALSALGLAWMGLTPASVEARVVTVGSPARGPVYSSPYYYSPRTVVAQPLLLPRTGSNDYLYTYDNVYGVGASAAGRMDRVVTNPQPQLYYPRQQPRVYLGY